MSDSGFTNSDDFDKLLDEFISSQLKETEDELSEINDSKSNSSESQSPSVSLSDVISAPTHEDFDKLAKEERQLYIAFSNFINAVTSCGTAANIPIPEFHFSCADLLPRFRPSKTKNLNDDILNAWEVLISAQPTRLSSLPPNATDEQILSFAEKTTDSNLQSALLSYVETLIETDSCEIAYNLRKVKYEKHKIEKKIFEEQQQRHKKMRNYINAIRAKNFPIDAEMLVNNFFKTVRKDPEGAQKILENNPATFAPIQVDKIPSKFFGLIKPKPADGIKINKKLGKFLKNLKA